MKTMLRSIPGLILMNLLFGSCASTQQVGQVRDDVYYLPSAAPPVAIVEEPPIEEPQNPADDYYDPNASSEYSGSSEFYDMTYNDPYYYNYGRFGFNASMGWQSGWSGPGWGMGMGWGSGYNPWYSINFGWGSPYYPGWGYPYYGSPWGWNDPWYGYGYGGYYGPYGPCYCCYTPIIIGGSSGVVYGHRPSVNGGGMASTNVAGNGEVRASFRDPVGLNPGIMQRGGILGRTDDQEMSGTKPQNTRPNTISRPAERTSGKRPSNNNDRGSMERSNNGGSDRSGSFSSPRSIGGGGNSVGGSSGGGSRTGGGGRPR